MNERIKKLVDQSGIRMFEDKSFGWSVIAGTDNNVHNLVQLIAQECVLVLNKRFMGDLNREDMEVRRCIGDVKKHFGIEE
jgi:hypothetical protein